MLLLSGVKHSLDFRHGFEEPSPFSKGVLLDLLIAHRCGSSVKNGEPAVLVPHIVL